MRITIIAILIIVAFLIAFRATGEEELMFCDNCEKTLELKYEDGVFTEINYLYEWD